VYLVTALVPSDTACLANSAGNNRRTAVWISRLLMVDFVVDRKSGRFTSNATEEIVYERVHYGHGLGRYTGVGVHLLEHFVDTWSTN
jgi:hypothetical protein